MSLVEWAHQTVLSPADREFANMGENYAIRPTLFGSKRHRPFLYFGLNPLLGLSHQIGVSDALSWGVGVAMRQAATSNFQIRMSGGLFYDREDSLLASVIINGTHDLALRLNVYPGVVFSEHWWSPGFYLGVKDHGSVEIGLSLKFLPVGLLAIFH